MNACCDAQRDTRRNCCTGSSLDRFCFDGSIAIAPQSVMQSPTTRNGRITGSTYRTIHLHWKNSYGYGTNHRVSLHKLPTCVLCTSRASPASCVPLPWKTSGLVASYSDAAATSLELRPSCPPCSNRLTLATTFWRFRTRSNRAVAVLFTNM